MSPTALGLILVAAVAHASWNLFSKQAAAAAEFFIWPLAACAAVLYLPVVLVTIAVTPAHLAALNWVFLAGTGLLQSGYFLFLQLAYRSGDLSVAYPIGRGTGALLAALAGIALLGERPTPVAAAGIAAIIVGVVVIGLTPGGDAPGADPGQPPGRARVLTFAVATGAFIAAYTIWDKYAVASLHTPPVLQGYAAFPLMVIIFAPLVLRDRGRLAEVWRTFRPQVIGAAVLAPLAYILVLFALRFTAVSAVAPAREVSVLFGVILGGRLLGEGSLARRLVAAAAIVAGIIAIALS
jgi:drug/metabolite transporter (DMT)-like permease